MELQYSDSGFTSLMSIQHSPNLIRHTLLTNDLITVLNVNKLCFNFRSNDNNIARYVDVIVLLSYALWMYCMFSPYHICVDVQ